MIQGQFDKINERLAKWRKERKLTYENQREGFLGNVYEEVSEYFRANNDLERIDALCDIAVFCFNTFDMDYNFYREYSSNIQKPRIHDIIDSISFFAYKKFKNASFPNNYMPLTISRCFKLGNSLGFDFYKCMIETIKEIESRSGYYDPTINKFIKDKGAYDLKSAKKHFFMSIKYKENDDYWYFLTFKGKKKIKKWYKAKYSSCIW